jgi:hypothetical protein
MVRPTEKDVLSTQMVMSTMATGKRIKHMVRGFTPT